MTTSPNQPTIADLMRDSGVGFGTSGARGLADAMTDRICHAYTLGFLGYLESQGLAPAGGSVGLAGDFRPSSPRILAACAQAVRDSGRQPRYFGTIPTPALVHFGIQSSLPTLMATGSHIPADRNGIKFHTPLGEILKRDEAGILAQRVSPPEERFNAQGWFRDPAQLPAPDPAALHAYLGRYLEGFPADCLAGYRIGLYEHSSVARESLYRVLTGLGAQVERLGSSEVFIPVDTEAIRPEDQALGAAWGAEGRFDALISADGDGDRPLIGDQRGNWLRGDLAGILVARFLGATAVVTPVSSNSALELSGWFHHNQRTRIGSPYVIEGMLQAMTQGADPVVGYEANGGFLTGTDWVRDGRHLTALPTRDAILPVLGVLLLARQLGCPLSELGALLPPRYTASDRLKEFPRERAAARIAAWSADPAPMAGFFDAGLGAPVHLNSIDGLRVTFSSGDILHLRQSGNAPELRLYTEAADPARAQHLLEDGLQRLEAWRRD